MEDELILYVIPQKKLLRKLTLIGLIIKILFLQRTAKYIKSIFHVHFPTENPITLMHIAFCKKN